MFDLILKTQSLVAAANTLGCGGEHCPSVVGANASQPSSGPTNPSWVPVGPKETYTPMNWTPASNAWQPSGGGDDWTGPNNPFGPKIPLGAHGVYGSAPPGGSGEWASGECNFNGQAQCGMGPAPLVYSGSKVDYGVKPPPASGIGSGMGHYQTNEMGNVVNPWAGEI